MEGSLAWFEGTRGYGFIEPADGGGDTFFSGAALEADFGAARAAGDPVSYQVIDGERGPEAARVGATVVAATGDPVLERRDDLCGEVIEDRVSVIAGGDPTSDFVITARVRPGR